jgi:hypothetical protein
MGGDVPLARRPLSLSLRPRLHSALLYSMVLSNPTNVRNPMVRIGTACHSREMRALACKRTSLLVLDEGVTGIDYLKKGNEKGREKGEGGEQGTAGRSCAPGVTQS